MMRLHIPTSLLYLHSASHLCVGVGEGRYGSETESSRFLMTDEVDKGSENIGTG